METKYIEFKIFGSRDGKKACAFKIIEHFRTPEDSQVEKSMGWKVVVETTQDWWTKGGDKKIIMLEDNELVSLSSVLMGFSNHSDAKRNDPPKQFDIKAQEGGFFVSLRSWNVSHWFKMNQYDALRLLAFSNKAIENNMASLYSIDIKAIEYIRDICWTGTETVQSIKVDIPKIEEKHEDNSNHSIMIQNVDWTETPIDSDDSGCHCSICNKAFDEVKEEKIINFSTKKYGKPVCYNCQKTL